MTRLALLSCWHVHAADYLAEAAAHPEVEVAAIWDEDPIRGEAEAAARGVPFVRDLDAVLADSSIAGVIVTSATTAHADLVARAAAAGKHLFVEKVLAPTLAEALRLVETAARAGVVMTVALSRAAHPAAVVMRERTAAGAIGQPTAARVRLAHDGVSAGWLPARFLDPAEAGGGALIDLGAHPLYLVRLLLGMPERVLAMVGAVTGQAADDNAAVLLACPDGAIGVAETSFVGRGRGLVIEVSGVEGGLTWEQDEPVVTLHRRGAEAEPFALPAESPTPFARWVGAVRRGGSTAEDLRLALELSALAEAAMRSAAAGRAVALTELDGWAALTRRVEGGEP